MKRDNLIIIPRERDLGGFNIRRILPYAFRRMVGPFIFFDHIGPATFQPGQGINVRPHPHINLSTVTYLFEGTIRHRDSLGFDQIIEPGNINWMIAGRGIVHSERAPPDFLVRGGNLHGIQCWVALPAETEEIEPSFTHYPTSTLPTFTLEGVSFKLLLGKFFNQASPVNTHSNLFYVEAKFPQGTKLRIPSDGEREVAFYVVSGRIHVHFDTDSHQTEIQQYTMFIGKYGKDYILTAKEESHLMLLGGKPIGERLIYWNFVSSDLRRIEIAKNEWEKFPEGKSGRFKKIPGDDFEFIPLPLEVRGNPKGTIM